jgi:hypothetical protein
MGQKNLPLASGIEHAAAFERCGWTCRKKGNHLILTKPGFAATLSIPNHREVKRTIVQAQMKLGGLTEAQYLAAFYGTSPEDSEDAEEPEADLG